MENSHSPSSNQTPEYGQNYTSPYKATQKIYKPTESAEEKRKREREEAEKKRLNEEAFNAWCKKDKERKEDQKKKQQQQGGDGKEKNSSFASVSFGLLFFILYISVLVIVR